MVPHNTVKIAKLFKNFKGLVIQFYALAIPCYVCQLICLCLMFNLVSLFQITYLQFHYIFYVPNTGKTCRGWNYYNYYYDYQFFTLVSRQYIIYKLYKRTNARLMPKKSKTLGNQSLQGHLYIFQSLISFLSNSSDTQPF